MTLLDSYLVQAHQQDLLRAAARHHRLDRSGRRPRRSLSVRAR